MSEKDAKAEVVALITKLNGEQMKTFCAWLPLVMRLPPEQAAQAGELLRAGVSPEEASAAFGIGEWPET